MKALEKLLMIGTTTTAMLIQASPALAALEEVIVTAQKRAQSLQDVPISVQAVSGEQINDLGIVDMEELTRYTPNVSINQGAAAPNLFVRGIGSGANAGFEQSVGLYIDGVYSGRGLLSSVPLTMDLERVEVLKGPQGVLFGKNTVAGAISITSAKPTHEFLLSADMLYQPDDNEQHITVVVNGELTEALAGRIAIRRIAMDGWWDNEFDGSEGPHEDSWYGRGALSWDATDYLTLTTKIEYGDFDRRNGPNIIYQSEQPTNFRGNQVFPVISDGEKGARDFPRDSDTQTEVFALNVDWDLAFATLTSISAYSAYDSQRLENPDNSPQPAIHRTYDEQYKQYSQELRLVSPGGETLDWIAGAYYQRSDLEVDRINLELDLALLGPLSVPALVQTAGPTDSAFQQDSQSWAIFAQGTWSITERLRTTIGVRYNEESKDVDKTGSADGLGVRAGTELPGADLIVFASPTDGALISDIRSHNFIGLSRDEQKWTGSWNVQFDAGDNAMLYASLSSGFKGGGFDEAYSGSGPTVRTGNPLTGEPDDGTITTGIDASVLEFEDEDVLAYELGVKASLADGAAEINLALFRMEYDSLQVSSVQGDVFNVSNAGESTSQGVELDGRWAATEQWVLAGGIAWLDARYDKFPRATCTVAQLVAPEQNPGCLREDGTNIVVALPPEAGGQDLSGETMQYAPDWSASVSADWRMPINAALDFRSTLNISYKDEFFSALHQDPNTLHDDATKIDLRLAIESTDGRWLVALVGKNLTDEHTTVANENVPTSNSGTYFGIPERPRSIALQASYVFE